MTWYAAHIITYVKFLDGIQDKYPVWENIVLIDAPTDNAAHEMAEQIGHMDYDGGELSWEGRPGIWVFAGIRKLITCDTIASQQIDPTDHNYRPGHGTEVTYSQLEIADAATFSLFVQGEPVNLLYEE